jgi:hypothetical protein
VSKILKFYKESCVVIFLQVSAISSGENNSAVFVLQIKKIMSNLMLVFVYVSAHKILNFHVLKNSLFANSI